MVVGTKKSAPRPLGSKLAINDPGEVSGGVSGGCIEGAVVQIAEQVMHANRSSFTGATHKATPCTPSARRHIAPAASGKAVDPSNEGAAQGRTGLGAFKTGAQGTGGARGLS